MIAERSVIPGQGDGAEQSTIPCHDPATLEHLGEVPVMGPDEVRAAVERGRRAQAAWGRTSFAERRRVLRSVLDAVLSRQEEICRLASRDSGKTLADAAMGEVIPVCEKLRYTIAHGARALRPERRSSGLFLHKSARVEYHPLGVVGVIAPWNFPFHNLACPTIPALFAGNAVVVKVSEHTSWSAEPYAALFRDALERHGHDPDLVQVVTGYGETGRALVESGADKIFFTGSPQNGRKVMEAASAGPVDVVLELGGKDPMIVCEDADLDHAVSQAMLGVYTACGQMCVAVERVYVHDAVYDEFVRRVAARARELRQGPPLDVLVDVGATTMPRQLSIIDELIGDAVAKGATVLVGGRRNDRLDGQYYEPTILTNVDHSMRIMQEEHFGPVMLVQRVHDEDEAVHLANDAAYGLGASVFTKNRRRGAKLASRVRSGMTVVNDYGIAYMVQSLPFGGVGISGIGRINGPEGLRACCYAKAVVGDRLPVGRGMSVYPIQPSTFELLESATRLIFGSGLRRRAKAAADTARNAARELRSRRG